MKISVIVPVYNAEKYIEYAVESAIKQPETGEVILVEDCSPDGSLAICERLASYYDNVRLVRHDGGKNLGAGLSRNLGIVNARCEYIAFLDADDYYLSNRFTRAKEIFEADTSVDGVYEAVGSEFETKEAEHRFYQNHAETDPVATITKEIPPDQLFYYLVVGGAGYFHLDGLVVKKESLEAVGMFPDLRLHQDTAVSIKLASKFKLYPGDIHHPVAIRRLHANNRITNPKINFHLTRFMMFENLRMWIHSQNVENYKKRLVDRRYHRYKYLMERDNRNYILALWHLIYRKIKFREDEAQYLNIDNQRTINSKN